MKRALTFLLSTMLIASDASAGPEMAPIGRVFEFWDALKTDKVSAKAMVADDAEMGFGDVGGPFDIDVLAGLRRNCELGTKISLKPLQMDSRSISLVETELDCLSDQVHHAVVADFMIEKDKVAGFYLPQGSASPTFSKSNS